MNTYSIRPAEEQDLTSLQDLLQAVYALHRSMYPGTFQPGSPTILSRGAFICILEDKDQAILVADMNGAVVGMTHIMKESWDETLLEKALTRVSIEDISIDPNYQRQGIGSALLEAAEAWAKERDITSMSVLSYARNKNALSFYEKGGFEPRSIRLQKKL